MSENPVSYRLKLRQGRERSVHLRHPWVFSGAVEEVEALPDAQPGDLGDLVDADGTFLARGTVQPDSQIICRILAWEPVPIDAEFFRFRFARAFTLRERMVRKEQTNAYRLINGEGDELPGLVVDRYGKVLTVQTLTAGMQRLQPIWLDVLSEVTQAEVILERGEKARREPVQDAGEENLILRGTLEDGPIEILENGQRFLIDPRGGQKTGFYLDQRENRALVQSLSKDQKVLNLFGYTGAFSVAAGVGGAAHVVQVETSAAARDLAARSWKANGLPEEKLELIGADAFEFLRRDTRTFDLIVLDPPPLARAKGQLDHALRAYKDLHLWSFCRARPGGLIATFSCSQHVTGDLFQKVVFGASHDVRASAQWLARLGAAADHPVHLNHPQGEYLKGMLLRVLNPGAPPSPRGWKEPAKRR